jgi:HTH-type transcriptional regulator/antitoxin HigA
MRTTAKSTLGPDSYQDLIDEFRLAPIRGDGQLGEAIAMIDRLLGLDLDEGARAYLDVLISLVEDYEEEHVEFADASEADVLRELMRLHGLTQTALAEEVGIVQATISDVLKGERSLTKGQVVTLANRFKVDPGAFPPRPE